MIDLHCHLLPGIDDGPATMDQSIELSRIAVTGGIRHSVVTPHIHPGRYANNTTTITAVYQCLKNALKEHRIPLELTMAAEVRLSVEVLALVAANDVPFYGPDSNKIMLLEMPHSHILPGSDNLVKWLLARNITPMIAHPERNKEVMRNPAKIKPFTDMGCLLQVTAGSVAGRFGDAAQKTAEQLLHQGLVSVLASDGHNAKARPPLLNEGVAAAANIIGEIEAEALVTVNPQKILSGDWSTVSDFYL